MKLKIFVPTLIISLSGVVQANSIEFSPVKVPETDAEKRSILASESVKINDKSHKIGYHTILRSGDKFSDRIFGQIVDFESNPILYDGLCPDTYTSINAGHRKDKYGRFHQCLKLKPGMETAASRLETRRYAAMKGATTEFSKEEGITYNPITNTLYVAMTKITDGMEDNTMYDLGGNNKIKLPYNSCGGIYALDLATDKTIGSNFVAKNMYGLVMGKITQTYDKNNKCDLDGIANPDNISFFRGMIHHESCSGARAFIYTARVSTQLYSLVIALERYCPISRASS